MSSETTQRTREPCEACGVPYYVDENDSCPYCETTADVQSRLQDEPTASDPQPATPESQSAMPESPPSSESSLLDRVKNGVRGFFSR